MALRHARANMEGILELGQYSEERPGYDMPMLIDRKQFVITGTPSADVSDIPLQLALE